jgi:hypothetical protein
MGVSSDTFGPSPVVRTPDRAPTARLNLPARTPDLAASDDVVTTARTCRSIVAASPRSYRIPPGNSQDG